MGTRHDARPLDHRQIEPAAAVRIRQPPRIVVDLGSVDFGSIDIGSVDIGSVGLGSIGLGIIER